MYVHSNSSRVHGAVIAALLMLFAITAYGQSIAKTSPSLRDIVEEAVIRDVVVAKFRLAIRDKQLTVLSQTAQKGFGLSIGLSDPDGPVPLLGFEISEVGNGNLDYSFGVSTNIVADLPYPLGSVMTGFSVVGPVKATEIAEADDWIQPPFSFGATTAFQQPLAPLLGLDTANSQELEILHSVKKAERGYRAQIRAVTRDILNQITVVLQYQNKERSGSQELADIEQEVKIRREIYNDNEESYSLQTLLFELEKSRRNVEITELLLEQARTTFEERTGYRYVPYLDEITLEVPEEEDANRAPDFVDAILELRISEHRISEEKNSLWPEVSLNVNYDWRQRSLGAGVGFNLSRSLIDGGLQQIQDEQLAIARKSAQLASQIALRDYSESLIDVSNSIRDIEYRTWETRERARLSALEVEELRIALAAGIVTHRDLVHAELKYELIDREEQILRAERWKLRIEIDSLIDADSLETLMET